MDQVLPGERERIACFLFVAGHHDRHAQLFERAGGAKRLECEEHHDVAPLHVYDPGAAGFSAWKPLEALERAVFLEDCVEMPDAEKAGGFRLTMGAAMLGDPVA